METYSLTEYVEKWSGTLKRRCFVCTCKKCNGGKQTPYITNEAWLDIAFVLMDSDEITEAQYKELNHLAVSQWDVIAPCLSPENFWSNAKHLAGAENA